MASAAPPTILAESGDVIGKIGDLLLGNRAHHVGHGAVMAVAAVVLVFGRRLGEIVLALVGDARDVLLAGKIGIVAVVAEVLVRQRLAPRDPRGIAGIGRRHRLRQGGDEVGKHAQIVVGERLRRLVHRLESAQLFAKHEELDQRIGRLLAAERGRVLGFRLPVLAVTGETGDRTLFDGFGARRKGDGSKRQRRYYFTHRAILALSSLRGAKRRSNPAFLCGGSGLLRFARNDVLLVTYCAATFGLP